jgi:hypothetical protein
MQFETLPFQKCANKPILLEPKNWLFSQKKRPKYTFGYHSLHEAKGTNKFGRAIKSNSAIFIQILLKTSKITEKHKFFPQISPNALFTPSYCLFIHQFFVKFPTKIITISFGESHFHFSDRHWMQIFSSILQRFGHRRPSKRVLGGE